MVIIFLHKNEWLIHSKDNGTQNMGMNRNAELGEIYFTGLTNSVAFQYLVTSKDTSNNNRFR
jgi:hypothetical protein